MRRSKVDLAARPACKRCNDCAFLAGSDEPLLVDELDADVDENDAKQ
jgi:hypothetical protein